jgi:Tol biopolymer transport system component
MRRAFLGGVFTVVLAGGLLLPALQARAAFPGANGRIAFYSDRSDGNYEIYSVNPDGSGLLNLTNNPAFDATPSWSADGARIAFVSERSPGGLYTMNADGSGQTLVTSACVTGFPAWSPDGSKIAFTACGDDIFVVNVDGTGLTNLTSTVEFDRFPSWSPDGARIAFSRIDFSTYTDDIWVMDADGSNPVNLTNDSGSQELHPDWSPDGSKIAYYRNGELFAMNPEGSGQVNLTNTPTLEESFPAWSPDGTRMAFQMCAALCDIWTMAVDGTDRTNLTGGSNAQNRVPDWQPLPQMTVSIDIKPGSTANPIRLSSTGKIPVAILSTSSFDATTVDPSSVCFGDAEAPAQRDCTAANSSLDDVNTDGRLDLLLLFEMNQTSIDPGDTQACLTGRTFSGQGVVGCDSIKTL